MKKLLYIFGITLLLFGCMKEKGQLISTKSACDSTITYSGVIYPIIQSNCAISGCHVNKGSGPLDYTIYANVDTIVVNGKLKDRMMVKKDMPASAPMSDADIAKFQCWMDRGAPNN